MSSLFVATLLALATQPLADSHPERECTLAEAQIGDWELWARMEIDQSGAQPVIQDIVCEMERSWLELTTGIVGGLRVTLENNDAFRRRDVRAIGLGEIIWEYRWRSSEAAAWRFADVAYPAQPVIDTPCDSIHGTCMVVENGTPLIRRSAGEPWLPLDTLGNELLRARTLRVGVTDHPADDRAALRWIELPLDTLPEALAWCQAAMRADGVRRLNRQ
jgi:hypothetical protein